ncbi:MAG: hypothetical protein II399_01615 [Lachnospiraceae bacterium]|nr:hypothetical protein [Lachnospiraceae bacterium]
MKYEYKTRKGVNISLSEMVEIAQYYEAACAGEQVQWQYSNNLMPDDMALNIGYEICRRRDKYDYDLSEAEEDVMDDACLTVQRWLGLEASEKTFASFSEYVGRGPLDREDVANGPINYLSPAEMFACWIYGPKDEPDQNESVREEFEKYFSTRDILEVTRY